MQAYIIRTVSGHHWLIENASSEDDALQQYYESDAEQHLAVEQTDNEEHMSYLREIGQAS